MAAPRRRVPFEFVLDALTNTGYRTNPMFGCTAIYVGDRIVFALRDRPSHEADNGVWVATTHEHHASLKKVLPSLKSIGVLGDAPTGWQNIPAESRTFEEEALRACELVLAGDPRIGKIPARRRPGDR